MAQLSLFFGVLFAAIVTVPLARRIGLPQPVLMTVIGIVLALLPWVPDIRLEPDLILPLVLPPLIYAAAQRASIRYFKANARVILLLAVALVLVTTAAVAGVFRLLAPTLPLGAAVALGALVSPPDPVAAAAVAGSIGMPRRLLGILETEGLFNDVVALVIYAIAVSAVTTGRFSALGAVGDLVLSALLALVIGIGLGWLSGKLMSLLADPTLQVALSLLVPFAAYEAADKLHGSGVLAVLVCSLWIGDHEADADEVTFRLVGGAFWEIVELLITGTAFGLIGLEFASVRHEASHWPSLLGDAGIIIGVVVGVRLLWLLPGAWLTNALDRRRGVQEEASPLNWRESVVLWWSGMRGVASVALALAIPFAGHGGAAFPGREEIIVIAFAVVLFTLVVQGFTLPGLVRRLGLGGEQDALDAAERRLWYRATKAALVRLKEIAKEEDLPEEMTERLRRLQSDRVARFRPDIYDEEQRAEARERVRRGKEFRRVQDEMLAASRREVLTARAEPGADPALADRVLRALDIRSARK